MRSEVVKIHRYDINHAMPGTPDRRIASNLLSEMCPEIKIGETKSVRISAEIVDEKGEEKVGSKCEISRIDDAAYSYAYLDGIRCPILDPIVKDWQPGESRKVKSILFETPSGVPVVEFVETPRERLVNAVKAFDGGGLLESDIVRRVKDYLAATEGEK